MVHSVEAAEEITEYLCRRAERTQIMKRFLFSLLLVVFVVFQVVVIPSYAMSPALPSFRSDDLEECNEYIRQNTEEWTPLYEDISFLGEFKYITAPIPLTSITYRLKCQTGDHVITYGVSGGQRFYEYIFRSMTQAQGPLPGNFLYSDSWKANTYYKVGNFYYAYYNNYKNQVFLGEMYWFDDALLHWGTLKFECSDTDLCDFRKELMELSTAQNAINRLLVATGFEPVKADPQTPATDISTDVALSNTANTEAGTDIVTATPAEPTPFPWLWVMVPAGVVLIAVAATTALVIRKKKKQ